MNARPRRDFDKHARFEEAGDEPPRRSAKSKSRTESFSPKWLRIVAGELGGQRVQYSGDPAIRPMKDRTRESVFNLLGGDLTGYWAIDLFAGTGALGFEAISRGAEHAVLLELSRPAITTVLANATRLRIADRVEIHNVDTLRWLKSFSLAPPKWSELPWVVFCCPPYRMWTTELDRLRDGLQQLRTASPVGSFFVVETEQDFDIAGQLPGWDWDIRPYKPAKVGIAEKLAN